MVYSEMGKFFHSEKMNLPDAESLGNGSTHSLPISLVGNGDEAFPLKPWLQSRRRRSSSITDFSCSQSDRKCLRDTRSTEDGEFAIFVFKPVLKPLWLPSRLQFVCTTTCIKTNLFGQDGWILASFFFCVLYPAILTSRLVNNPYVLLKASTGWQQYAKVMCSFPGCFLLQCSLSFDVHIFIDHFSF